MVVYNSLLMDNNGYMKLKRSKFPDLSKDGKVTMKDVLIAKGVIKKKNGKNKKYSNQS